MTFPFCFSLSERDQSLDCEGTNVCTFSFSMRKVDSSVREREEMQVRDV